MSNEKKYKVPEEYYHLNNFYCNNAFWAAGYDMTEERHGYLKNLENNIR